MNDDHDQRGERFFSGIIYATIASLVLWALIIFGIRLLVRII